MIIGDGIIILLVIWLVCIILAVILSREPGPMKAASFAILLVAAIITIVLFHVPRGEPEHVDVTKQITKYDSYSSGRNALIVLSTLFCLVAAACWFLAHFVQPVYAPSF